MKMTRNDIDTKERSRRLLARLASLKQERALVEKAIWEPVARYVLPAREDVDGTRPGGRRGTHIYDGTAQGALQLFADGLHGYLVSPSIVWFNLLMEDRALNDVPEVRQWLQDVSEHLYGVFHRSNFYEEIRKHFEDGGSIGTAPLYCEEDVGAGRVVFTEVHPGRVYIAENHLGLVDTVYREVKLTARQAVRKFGQGAFDPVFLENAERNPFATHGFVHVVEPREGFDPRMRDALSKPHASTWLHLGGGAYGKRIVSEGGYDEMPYIVWRYRVCSGEVYGRSPASDILSEIQGLNLLGKTMLGAAERAVNPPLNVPEKMKGKVSLVPAGL